MAIGQNFYPDEGERDIANFAGHQSGASLAYGDQAARYADPFMDERKRYQKSLADLMENPGDFASSPVYKFAYDQGLEALNRKGSVRSGSKLAALEKYGQGMAGQQYFNQAKLLSDLAVGGSSPAAAGLAYARGTERSQDYGAINAAARAAGNRGGGSTGGSQQRPWWETPVSNPSTGSGYSGASGQPWYAGGGYNPNTGMGAGYEPSSGAGTGGISLGTLPGGGGYDPYAGWAGADYFGDGMDDQSGGGYYSGYSGDY